MLPKSINSILCFVEGCQKQESYLSTDFKFLATKFGSNSVYLMAIQVQNQWSTAKGHQFKFQQIAEVKEEYINVQQRSQIRRCMYLVHDGGRGHDSALVMQLDSSFKIVTVFPNVFSKEIRNDIDNKLSQLQLVAGKHNSCFFVRHQNIDTSSIHLISFDNGAFAETQIFEHPSPIVFIQQNVDLEGLSEDQQGLYFFDSKRIITSLVLTKNSSVPQNKYTTKLAQTKLDDDESQTLQKLINYLQSNPKLQILLAKDTITAPHQQYKQGYSENNEVPLLLQVPFSYNKSFGKHNSFQNPVSFDNEAPLQQVLSLSQLTDIARHLWQFQYKGFGCFITDANSDLNRIDLVPQWMNQTLTNGISCLKKSVLLKLKGCCLLFSLDTQLLIYNFENVEEEVQFTKIRKGHLLQIKQRTEIQVESNTSMADSGLTKHSEVQNQYYMVKRSGTVQFLEDFENQFQTKTGVKWSSVKNHDESYYFCEQGAVQIKEEENPAVKKDPTCVRLGKTIGEWFAFVTCKPQNQNEKQTQQVKVEVDKEKSGVVSFDYQINGKTQQLAIDFKKFTVEGLEYCPWLLITKNYIVAVPIDQKNIFYFKQTPPDGKALELGSIELQQNEGEVNSILQVTSLSRSNIELQCQQKVIKKQQVGTRWQRLRTWYYKKKDQLNVNKGQRSEEDDEGQGKITPVASVNTVKHEIEDVQTQQQVEDAIQIVKGDYAFTIDLKTGAEIDSITNMSNFCSPENYTRTGFQAQEGVISSNYNQTVFASNCNSPNVDNFKLFRLFLRRDIYELKQINDAIKRKEDYAAKVSPRLMTVDVYGQTFFHFFHDEQSLLDQIFDQIKEHKFSCTEKEIQIFYDRILFGLRIPFKSNKLPAGQTYSGRERRNLKMPNFYQKDDSEVLVENQLSLMRYSNAADKGNLSGILRFAQLSQNFKMGDLIYRMQCLEDMKRHDCAQLQQVLDDPFIQNEMTRQVNNLYWEKGQKFFAFPSQTTGLSADAIRERFGTHTQLRLRQAEINIDKTWETSLQQIRDSLRLLEPFASFWFRCSDKSKWLLCLLWLLFPLALFAWLSMIVIIYSLAILNLLVVSAMSGIKAAVQLNYWSLRNDYNANNRIYQSVQVRILDLKWMKEEIGAFYNFCKDTDNIKISRKEFVKLLLYKQKYFNQLLLVGVLPYLLQMVSFLVYCSHFIPYQYEPPGFFDAAHPSTIVLRAFIVITTLYDIIREVLEVRKKGIMYFVEGWNYLQLTLTILTLMVVYEHTYGHLGWNRTDLVSLASFVTLMSWLNLFQWMRIHPDTAFFVKLLFSTLWDVKFFTIFFLIIILGIANSILVLDDFGRQNLGGIYESIIDQQTGSIATDAFMNIYLLNLGEYNHGSFGISPYKKILWFYFLFATIFTNIVFMNMLIGVMSDTFNKLMDDREMTGLLTSTKIYADFIDQFVKDPDITNNRYLYIIVPLKSEYAKTEPEDWEGGHNQVINQFKNFVKEIKVVIQETFKNSERAASKQQEHNELKPANQTSDQKQNSSVETNIAELLAQIKQLSQNVEAIATVQKSLSVDVAEIKQKQATSKPK